MQNCTHHSSPSSSFGSSSKKACSSYTQNSWLKRQKLRIVGLNVVASCISAVSRGAPRSTSTLCQASGTSFKHVRGNSLGVQQLTSLDIRSSNRPRVRCTAYRGDGQYGDFSVTQYTPFRQALSSPFNSDLSLDFDKTYLTGRRNLSVVPSLVDHSCELKGFEAFLQYRAHLEEAGEQLDLLQCALLIARHAHPDLDARDVQAEVSDLAAKVTRAHLRQPPESRLSLGQTIGYVLYDQLGFHGNCEDFYNPNNNCLNVVLAERKGSPVALALLHLLLAERLGVWCRAVLMPSHCFLKTQQGAGTFLLDPFNKGQVCSAGVVEARLNASWGFSSPVIRVGPEMISSPRLATKREVLLRLLSNLRESYWGPSSVTGRIRWSGTFSGQGEQAGSMVQRALVITRFMRATGGAPPTLFRDEGYILSCLGRHEEASKLLQHYLQETPKALDKDRVQEFLLDSKDTGSSSR